MKVRDALLAKNGRSPGRRPRAPSTAAVPVADGSDPPLGGAVLTLQLGAGNHAVARLLDTGRAAGEPVRSVQEGAILQRARGGRVAHGAAGGRDGDPLDAVPARAVRDGAARLQRAVAFDSPAPRCAPGVVALQRAIDFEPTTWEALSWLAKNVNQAKTEFEEVRSWLQTADTLRAGESKAIRAFIGAEIELARAFVKRWDTKKVSLADREKVISEIGLRVNAVRDLPGKVSTLRAQEAEDARIAEEKEATNRRDKEERRRVQKEQEAANAEKRRRADEERTKKEAQDRLLDEQRALEDAQSKAANEQARIEQARSLAAEKEEIARAAAAKRLTQLMDARGRADQVDASVQASLTIVDGLGIFADAAEVDAMRARGDAARAAATAARALLVDDADPAAGDAQLATAKAEAGAMATLAGAARASKEAKEQEIARRLKQFKTAVLALKAQVVKTQMKPWLDKLEGLSEQRRLASLDDRGIEGGIAAAEHELKTAATVEARLTGVSKQLNELLANPLFAPVGQEMLEKFKGLEWSEVVESLDAEIGAGIMDLEVAATEAAKTVARTAAIKAAVEHVGLEPMRAHLTSALEAKPDSWNKFVADVQQLDRDLAFAQEIDRRRKAATDALAALQEMGTPASAENAKNIEKWLPLNAALTWAEQRRGVVSADDVGGAGATVEKPGVLKIETRLAQYNKPYADALAAAAAQAEAQAEAQAAIVKRQRAVQDATARLLGSRTEATLIALYNEAKISRGTLVRTYRTDDDTGLGTFSVEYKLAGVNRIIVHAHCDAQGQPMPDHAGSTVGAVHWKRVEDSHRRGAQYSHKVPVALRAHLIDPTEAKNNRDTNPRLQGT